MPVSRYETVHEITCVTSRRAARPRPAGEHAVSILSEVSNLRPAIPGGSSIASEAPLLHLSTEAATAASFGCRALHFKGLGRSRLAADPPPDPHRKSGIDFACRVGADSPGVAVADHRGLPHRDQKGS